MPAPLIALGMAVLAALAVAAVRLPAPRVSEDAWTYARAAVIPVSLLWMVSLTVCGRPTAFAFAMVSGAGCCAVAWVMRAPPEPPLVERGWGGPGGGGDGGPEPCDPPPGGDGVDWDAFERAAFEAWAAAARPRR